MALDQIFLTDFRNHADTRLGGTAAINLLVGENGAGKTNVLEALSLLAPGRGLRRAPLMQMSRAAGAGSFAVGARLMTAGAGDAARLGTGTAPGRLGRRLVRVNGAEASTASLAEWLAISWLTPAMDGLFTDSAGGRRRYLDRLTLALDPTHARNAARYEVSLRERNRLLAGETEPDPAWLDSLEAQMAEAGALVSAARARLVKRLGAALAETPEGPFARPVLRHVLGGAVEPEMLALSLAAARPRDRAAQRTLEGPHRDELEVFMLDAGSGERIPAALASTGEQKALLIAITLAHAELAAAGRPGVLLLDEVAAHLDPLRRTALFERLEAGAAQVWLTGTELAPFNGIAKRAAVWRLADGTVERA